MSGQDGTKDVGELQFDRVESEAVPSPIPDSVAVTCAQCQQAITTEYYDINGHVVCDGCRIGIEAAAETPRGVVPFVRAALFGVGAGVAGAILYYAVIAITDFEIGLVAILIGYMVGYSVRKGAAGRGGRRFQVLAAALTYAAVALAYTPLAFSGAAKEGRSAQPQHTTAGANTATPATATPASEPENPSQFVIALLMLLGIIAVLPVLVIVNSLPSGVISAVIIFFGMSRAWSMTGAPVLNVFGPYTVGGSGVAPA